MKRILVAGTDRIVGRARYEDAWASFETTPAPRIECLAIDPTDPDRVWCGSFDDGLFVSTDGGRSFTRSGKETFGEVAVTSIALTASDPETILIGTEPSCLYRSETNGETWELVSDFSTIPSRSEWAFPPRPSTHHVRWIEIHPENPEHWYVGIEAGALLLTRDGGVTWTDRPPGSRRDNHWMETHRTVPDRVYAAAGDGYAESEDGGLTWTHPQEGLDHRYVWSVAVDPGDPATRLVSCAKSARNAHRKQSAASYLYRRSGSKSWEQITTEPLPVGTGVMRYVLASGVNAGEFVAAGNTGLFRSVTAGRNWEMVPGPWPFHEDDAPIRSIVSA